VDSILVDRADGVVTITLNRPERKNALRADDWTTLREVFDAVAGRVDDRVVVVTGAGGEFCAGADLTSIGTARQPLDMVRDVGRAAASVIHLLKPVIAKVDGVAVGAGCNLALSADLVVASERARFSEIFARRGLSLDFAGSWLLPRIVGMQRAKQLAFFGDVIDAATAHRLGLVTEVVAPDALDGHVAEWAGRLADGPAVALSLTKRLLEASWTSSLEQALEAEAVAQAHNLAGPEAAEALRAFKEKRDPTFPKEQQAKRGTP
jgi:2-(1,2-epoxy-1,2-dihydrophenyl)acetyl-CoA isomerase